MAEGSDRSRARIYVAAVLAVGLVVAVLVVVLAGSGSEGEASAADPACVEAWNGDETMVSFGQHQFSGHGYERVQVLRVTDSGEPTKAADENCAVVFAATALDPEPGARAQVQLEGKWTGFESLEGVSDDQIAELQAEAFAAVNASLTTSGTIEPRSR